jgi:periplasmic protein CpxP/Spy
MRSIRFRLLVAFLAVLLGTALGKGQTADTPVPPPAPMHAHGGHGFGMGGHMMGFFADYLNLSDAQQAQMKSIMQKGHAAMKPLMQQSRQIDQQLRQHVEGAYNEENVRTLATQKAALEVELTVQRTQLHHQLFQVLTTDQQSKMKEMEARHQARMQKHMQQAPPAPPQE